MSKTVLFLYGTLKTGGQSNHLLAGAEFLGPARTLSLYRLYGIGWHPGLVLDRANGVSIHGELWAVDDALLGRLDEYEGVPSYFTREAIAIADHFGEVQAYFFNGVVPTDARGGDRWPLPV
jgi:gamma-glutamylaminecyclotransferase